MFFGAKTGIINHPALAACLGQLYPECQLRCVLRPIGHILYGYAG